MAWEPDAYRAFLTKTLQRFPRPVATVAADYLVGYAAAHPGSAGQLCLVAPT